MPRSRECDYCGADIEPGTGTMFVRNNGSTVHFCSSKCEKNADLGREARNLEWTESGHAAGVRAEADEDEAVQVEDEETELAEDDVEETQAAEDAVESGDADDVDEAAAEDEEDEETEEAEA